MTHRGDGRAANGMFGRRGARFAAVGAVGVAAAVLAVTPAFAKGSATLGVSPGTVKLGQSVHVKGQGDSDALQYAKFCAQERVGTHGAWHTVKCGRIVTMGASEAKVDVRVKAGHRGVLQFRGVLYGVDGPRGGHPRVDITTQTKTVHVR
ncbi:membrane protein [Streptomyces noursei ATCC 11455]|nr:membrane protein [Streptomyces noursei ATCC 11455]